jgi:hypothetical protein
MSAQTREHLIDLAQTILEVETENATLLHCVPEERNACRNAEG